MSWLDLLIALAKEWGAQAAVVGILANHSLMMYRKMTAVHGNTDQHLAAQTAALTALVKVLTTETRNGHGPILHALDALLPAVERLENIATKTESDIADIKEAIERLTQMLMRRGD